ncbi:hypothetical protein FSP39_008311 [Pinctada imbricata]|uniref:Uncharacterized protein n=1 Tax=Pinctada imbricata TaxID=66713 RepID=A0AA88XQR6_PINIB|nr:hypothetical protein FSP39_008311 [Pinctada imbricata]
MDDPETVNSITMSFLATPVVVVLDVQTHFYYFPNFDLKDVTIETMSSFLLDVKSGKLQAHGGTGFLQRLKRIFYDIFVTVLSVWESSRWLFLLMFGLPTCVVSVVCYSLCCMEPMDDGVVDSEDEDDEYDAIPEKENTKGINNVSLYELNEVRIVEKKIFNKVFGNRLAGCAS